MLKNIEKYRSKEKKKERGERRRQGEERKNQEEEEKLLRKLENQGENVAIEIPVYNVDDLSVMEWYQVYS